MPRRTCELCTAEEFEVGYGVRRKVQGVWDEVCDKCAAPYTEREVQKTIDFVEGLKREHSDVDWGQFLDKAHRSRRRLNAWKAQFETEPDRVKGFLRVCEDDSRWISRTVKRHLIDEYLRRTKATMEKVEAVEIQIDTADPIKVKRLQRRQANLNRSHDRIKRGIDLIEENLVMLDTWGLLKGPASWNVLNVTVSQAVQAYLRSQDYQQGKEKSDEHKIARAAQLATQGLSAEEVEAAKESGTAARKPEVESPHHPSQVIKGTKTKQSKKKAMVFFDANGGFPDFSWGIRNNGNGPKTITLSGCNSDPAAAEKAMRERVSES